MNLFRFPTRTDRTMPERRFQAPIRPTVRAVIRRDDRILVQVKQKPGSTPYLTLPGGKQEPGETLVECLKRECLEEIAAQVKVGPLLHVAEVFKPKVDGVRHQLEVLFACDLVGRYTPRMGPRPDPSQIATEWVSLSARATEFRPGFAKALTTPSAPQYLGVFDG
ncbi:NUDIX domain-containing protein [Aliiruegeria haliotis]|uniref:NUDIX domain-containing protein n=1 Tax=Aliiruegeria haliotis TaxID=1280846 RepID=A0A2T0RID3_9RHOB|nr:NUDIX domain-containing protein [Aliiruegeria haliotis]PRY20943.1 NUDIX domain-containing protein [Aliiruegeria haliotis]